MNKSIVRPYGAADWANLATLIETEQVKTTGCLAEEHNVESDPICAHIKGAHKSDDGGAWVVAQQSRMRAFGCFRKLPWDSEQLRMSAASIDYLFAAGSYNEQRSAKEMLLEELLVEAQHLGIWHMSVRVDAADLSSLHVLEEAGFITVDGILTFGLDLKVHRSPEPASDLQIRRATAADAPPAAALARTAFVHDRFHADPFIDRELADGLHAEWTRNSCTGKAADAVLVAEDEHGLIGFVTCKLPGSEVCSSRSQRTGTIVLVATAAPVRGRRIGYGLVMAALDWLRDHGCERVEIGTQLSNLSAARLYQACGFRLEGSSVSLRRLL